MIKTTTAFAALALLISSCGSASDSEDGTSLPASVGEASPSATIGEVSEPATFDDDATADRSDETTTPDGSAPCIVSLHGKGGDGRDTAVVDGVTVLSPRGNDEGWGGRQWNYLDAGRYDAAVAVVAASIDDAGCSAVAINGFSNGAAFAAKLYCQGETFGARTVGVVIDDPVPDAATAGCNPGPSVQAKLYWTGGLLPTATAGTDCGNIDWTCEGGVIVGIDAFAGAAGLEITQSPFTEHRPYSDAPEPRAWLDAVGG